MTLLEKIALSKHQISMLTEDDSVVLIGLFPELGCLWNVTSANYHKRSTTRQRCGLCPQCAELTWLDSVCVCVSDGIFSP